MTVGHSLVEVAEKYFNLTAPLGYASNNEKNICREELRIAIGQFYTEEKRIKELVQGLADTAEMMKGEPVEVKKHGLVQTRHGVFHKRDERCPDDCELGVNEGFPLLP